MQFEGPDISQIVALTGFVLSAAVILAIIATGGKYSAMRMTILALTATP